MNSIVQIENLFCRSSAEFGEGGWAGSFAGFAIFFGFFAGCSSSFGLEFLDATDFVDEALLTSEERVTLGTDIDGYGFFGTTSGKDGPATAGDVDLLVGGVDACFHKGYCIRVSKMGKELVK